MQQPTIQLQSPLRYHLRLMLVFGILHLINAALILSFGIVVLAELNLKEDLNAQASHTWSAPFFIITGILGIIIFCKPQNRALVISHNTFAITSCVFSTVVIITSAFSIKYYNCIRHAFYWHIHWEPFDCNNKIVRDIGKPMYGVLVALSILELVFSIVSTIYSFRIYNCCAKGCGDCGGSCADDCQCCCNQQVQPYTQMYQMQPYLPNQLHFNNMAPQYQPRYPSPAYIQQICNQQIGIPVMQQGEVVTSSSGQQLMLMPVSEVQTTSPVAGNRFQFFQ